MLDDIVKTARTHIHERLASPLIGSFVIAWSIWNYKFLVILFSAASVSQTFALINSIAFPDFSALFFKGFLFPALTTAAYIFVYPYPARFVYEFTQKRQKEMNETRRQIENETPLTIEESRKIRSELQRREGEHEQEMDRKDSEIERLKAEISSFRTSSQPPPEKSSSEKTHVLTPTQLAMLVLVESLNGEAPEKALITMSKEPKVKAEFDLGELVKLKLLRKKYDYDGGNPRYEFTHDGRKYLVEHRESQPT
jgi:hypothetical protein